MLSAYKRTGGLDVFLKLNTGMNRLGFTPEQFSCSYGITENLVLLLVKSH